MRGNASRLCAFLNAGVMRPRTCKTRMGYQTAIYDCGHPYTQPIGKQRCNFFAHVFVGETIARKPQIGRIMVPHEHGRP